MYPHLDMHLHELPVPGDLCMTLGLWAHLRPVEVQLVKSVAWQASLNVDRNEAS